MVMELINFFNKLILISQQRFTSCPLNPEEYLTKMFTLQTSLSAETFTVLELLSDCDKNDVIWTETEMQT